MWEYKLALNLHVCLYEFGSDLILYVCNLDPTVGMSTYNNCLERHALNSHMALLHLGWWSHHDIGSNKTGSHILLRLKSIMSSDHCISF